LISAATNVIITNSKKRLSAVFWLEEYMNLSKAVQTNISRGLVFAGLFTVLFFCLPSYARYSGGSGDPNDPYKITTPQDLNDIGNYEEDWDKYFVLVNDVNLAGRTYSTAIIAPDVNNSNHEFDGTPFTGVFDGNDHKIICLTIDSRGAVNHFLGLFGCIGVYGQVNNLGIEGGSVNGDYRVGGLVGENVGSISKCYSTGDVKGNDDVGGLLGFNFASVSHCYSTGDVNGNEEVGGLMGGNSGNISNCYSTGDVSGDYWVGGLVGGIGEGSVSNCYSIGNVSGGYCVGGLVGQIYFGIILDCYSTGDVSAEGDVGGLVGHNNYDSVSNCYSIGNVSGGYCVGGLVGRNTASVSNCYFSGSISGDWFVGGLVGQNGFVWVSSMSPGYIFNSYSTGSIQGASGVGGLVGYNGVGEIDRSFWNVQTSGEPNMCGLQSEYAMGCDPNCGKTTAQMQTKSTFTDAGWDFVEVWGIGENQTYPYLRTDPAGDSNHDKKVDRLDLAILASHWLENTLP
jgi:hypothetical protein